MSKARGSPRPSTLAATSSFCIDPQNASGSEAAAVTAGSAASEVSADPTQLEPNLRVVEVCVSKPRAAVAGSNKSLPADDDPLAESLASYIRNMAAVPGQPSAGSRISCYLIQIYCFVP